MYSSTDLCTLGMTVCSVQSYRRKQWQRQDSGSCSFILHAHFLSGRENNLPIIPTNHNHPSNLSLHPVDGPFWIRQDHSAGCAGRQEECREDGRRGSLCRDHSLYSIPATLHRVGPRLHTLAFFYCHTATHHNKATLARACILYLGMKDGSCALELTSDFSLHSLGLQGSHTVEYCVKVTVPAPITSDMKVSEYLSGIPLFGHTLVCLVFLLHVSPHICLIINPSHPFLFLFCRYVEQFGEHDE